MSDSDCGILGVGMGMDTYILVWVTGYDSPLLFFFLFFSLSLFYS